jgi:Flp pilus assembly protein TadD
MKKLVSAALVIMMALSLVACAGTGGGEKARVKCPACGYEFDAPVTDH